MNNEARKAYLVGSGIGNLAAAAYLIKDGGFPGANITIYEEESVLGGALDAAGVPEDGYIMRGERMMDLSLNAIELIDRNLYERTCDVRWWATDSAVVDCAASPAPAAVSHASQRLGVILGAYTVYLDLWLCALDGTVLANGRPDRYPVRGRSVASEPWFRQACGLASGDDYVAADVTQQPLLGGAQVATYCASVRQDGRARGRPIGIMAIHFDWEPQARAITEGVRVAG